MPNANLLASCMDGHVVAHQPLCRLTCTLVVVCISGPHAVNKCMQCVHTALVVRENTTSVAVPAAKLAADVCSHANLAQVASHCAGGMKAVVEVKPKGGCK